MGADRCSPSPIRWTSPSSSFHFFSTSAQYDILVREQVTSGQTAVLVVHLPPIRKFVLPTIEQLVVSYTISDPVLPQMQDLMVHHEIQEPSAHIPAIEQGVYRYQPERLITTSQEHPLTIRIAFVPCESRIL